MFNSYVADIRQFQDSTEAGGGDQQKGSGEKVEE